MILLAAVTCSIHFVQLVAIRRMEPAAMRALAPIVSLPWKWPSIMFALDLLAWDLFFGLSMLLAAPIFEGSKLQMALRRVMFLSGSLCLAGLPGPALGDLRFQSIAIVGYAGLGPVVFLLLSLVLSRTDGT
jgi:hypothetical protein